MDPVDHFAVEEDQDGTLVAGTWTGWMVFLDFERRHRTKSEKKATLESESDLFLTLGWVLPVP